MIYKVKTITGDTIDLGQPTQVKINKSSEAVADDILIEFPAKGDYPECQMLLVSSNGDIFFKGSIDTQKIKCNNNGAFLTLSARSLASYLLDNEACPQTYYLPSLPVIFNRHAKPYGFIDFRGDVRTFPEEFVVAKGMSEWEVLETFCNNYLRTSPKVTADGIISVENITASDYKLFSNKGNGIKYNSIYEEVKRYKLYSKVFVRAQKDDNYSLKIIDKDAVSRGINTKRYLNAVENNVTPAVCGELMLSRAKKSAYEIYLSCPGQINANVGDKAVIDDYLLGDFQNLEISKIKYTLNKSCERTEFTLQRSDV